MVGVDGVTPRQAIELMAHIRGANHGTAGLLAALDIEQWADRRSDKLSGGVKRLAAFCMTAVNPGRLVMFDEPTNDVDPTRRRLLWTRIRELADTGCAVLLVTHNVLEAERAVDLLAILDNGAMLAQGTPHELRGEQAARLRWEAVAVDTAAAAGIATAHGGTATGRRVVGTIDADDATATVVWLRREREAERIDEFALSPTTLEDVYIRLVENGAKEERDEALAS